MKHLTITTALLLLFAAGQARIIHVPSKIAETIQQGIDIAHPGDTVLVEEGRYFENISFKGKNLVVASYYMLTGERYYIDNTVIDGSKPADRNHASVVRFVSRENKNATLMGFTITRGSGSLIEYHNGDFAISGGGILIINAGASIVNNNIVFNTLHGKTSLGGGVFGFSDDDNPYSILLSGNNIAGNVCICDNVDIPGKKTARAGGVYAQGTELIMTNNIVKNNELRGTGDGFGAGCMLYNTTEKTVLEGNEFCFNTVQTKRGHGGGLFIRHASPKIMNNIIHHNFAAWGGGVGVFSEPYHKPCVMINNTITGNRSTRSGSGIYADKANPVVFNSIIWNKNDGVLDIAEGNADLTLRNSLVSDINLSSIKDQVFYCDPTFEDDCFMLCDNSPGVGLGIARLRAGNLVHHAPALDFSGCDRCDGPDTRIDAGAIESGHCCLPKPIKTALANQFAVAGEKTQQIAAQIFNQHENTIEVSALLKEKYHGGTREVKLDLINTADGEEYPDIDKVGLLDEGGGESHKYVYKASIETPDIEDCFNLSIQINNKDRGITLTYNDDTFFSTVGPVVFSHYEISSVDHSPDPLDQLNVSFFIQNAGKQTVVENVQMEVISLEPLFASVKNNRPVPYGNMEPGEFSKGDQDFIIKFHEDADNTVLRFKVNIYTDGMLGWSETVSVSGMKNSLTELPVGYKLSQNFPNPFNPSTEIAYQLPAISDVDLRVYNLLGQEVAVLVNKRQPAGYYKAIWNANGLASGVYYYKLIARDNKEVFTKTRKLTLLR